MNYTVAIVILMLTGLTFYIMQPGQHPELIPTCKAMLPECFPGGVMPDTQPIPNFGE